MMHDPAIQEILTLAEDYMSLRVHPDEAEEVFEKLEASKHILSTHCKNIPFRTKDGELKDSIPPHQVGEKLKLERFKMLVDVACARKDARFYPQNKKIEATYEHENELYNLATRPENQERIDELNASLCHYFMRNALQTERMVNFFPREKPRRGLEPDVDDDEDDDFGWIEDMPNSDDVVSYMAWYGDELHEQYLVELGSVLAEKADSYIVNESAREDYKKYATENPEKYKQLQADARFHQANGPKILDQFIANYVSRKRKVETAGHDFTIFHDIPGLN